MVLHETPLTSGEFHLTPPGYKEKKEITVLSSFFFFHFRNHLENHKSLLSFDHQSLERFMKQCKNKILKKISRRDIKKDINKLACELIKRCLWAEHVVYVFRCGCFSSFTIVFLRKKVFFVFCFFTKDFLSHAFPPKKYFFSQKDFFEKKIIDLQFLGPPGGVRQ